ncbi:MAG: response regulator [Candidatus Nanopelagicales bacterium]|nr:response regulator [Candidatus Nanopelagicales bacterium]
MADTTPDALTAPQGQRLSGKRALVIDGDCPERRRLTEFLSGWDLSIEVTANPLQGAALLWDAAEGARPVDLVLLGPHGHRVQKEQFAAVVRCEPRLATLPMIYIDEGIDHGQRSALRQAGFCEAVPLPLDKTLLFDALHRAFGHEAPTTGVVCLMDRHATLGPSTPRLNILIADASAEQRRVLRAVLSRGGHRIYDVETGEQTLAALTKHSFDLVIISLELPGLGTADALRLLRFSVARGDWPAFIGLAQQPSMTQTRDYAAFGLTVVLPKPVRPQALLAAVADLLRGTHNEPADAEAMWGAHQNHTAELDCLDERALQEIEDLGTGPSFLADLIAEFLEEVQTRLEAVRQAAGTEQCYPRLVRFGHRLRDSAGSLGAIQLYQLGLIAARLPESLYEREGMPLLDRIEDAYQRTRSAFRQYLHQRELSRSPG